MSSITTEKKAVEEPTPYVVIDADHFGGPNHRPFNRILEAPRAKNGKKTRENTWLYIFTAEYNGTRFYKIGNTFDTKTYGSQKRFCPFIEYSGLVMVMHYGRALERLLGYYLMKNYKDSEWFANCDALIEAFIAALQANKHFQKETPLVMTNVGAFKYCFTARYEGRPAGLEEYLSLFMIRDKDKALYELHEKTIQNNVKKLLTKWQPKESAPAAPAVIDVTSAAAAAVVVAPASENSEKKENKLPAANEEKKK